MGVRKRRSGSINEKAKENTFRIELYVKELGSADVVVRGKLSNLPGHVMLELRLIYCTP